MAFKRGRIIEQEDVEHLLDLGKYYVYVIEGNEKEVHEDEAARRIAEAVMDEHMALTPPKEGRINITSTVDGLVSVNTKRLYEMNSIEHVASPWCLTATLSGQARWWQPRASCRCTSTRKP